MTALTEQILERLRELRDDEIAAHSQRFFKAGNGQYGEGDRFLGICVPLIRKRVKDYRSIALEETLELLKSPYHEARLLAALILVVKYASAKSRSQQGVIYRAYLSHTRYINNWDLVDASANRIVGAHLFSRDRKPIYRLARSGDLWERRIGIMSTFHSIKQRSFMDALAVFEPPPRGDHALILLSGRRI